MSHIAFRMMMESGVLRPGDREIRRGPGGVPLHASRQVSDVLNHAVDVLFGPELKSDQQKMTKVITSAPPRRTDSIPTLFFSILPERNPITAWIARSDQRLWSRVSYTSASGHST